MKTKSYLIIGQISLAFGFLGITLNATLINENMAVAIISAVLVGFSLVMNLTYLKKYKKEKKNTAA